MPKRRELSKKAAAKLHWDAVEYEYEEKKRSRPSKYGSGSVRSAKTYIKHKSCVWLTHDITSASPSSSIRQPTGSTCPPHLASDGARKVPWTIGSRALAPNSLSFGFDDFAGAGPDCCPR